ncbi:MAG: DUF2752 domain-containing protein [Planctomycetes bacterium]|nr:DUF2752 domain-containing protein [Planctomycetota bacterium]
MEASQQLNKSKFFSPASPRQRGKAALVFVAMVVFFALLWLGAHYKISLSPYGCGFEQKYDLPCPTCRMTTSAYKFARGEIFGDNGAFYTQPAIALLCCILIIIAFLAFFIAVSGVYFGFISRFFTEVKIRHLILALIIIIAAGWGVTLARALAERH